MVHAVGVDDDQTVLGLPKDLGQFNDRHFLRIDDVAKNVVKSAKAGTQSKRADHVKKEKPTVYKVAIGNTGMRSKVTPIVQT